jgi:arginine-tRNA-protein transferase
VPRVFGQHLEAPRPCDYLAEALASLEYRVMTRVTVAELEEMLRRGWRRQGILYFRPACGACFECRSLRLPLDRFVPTESQKRARRRAGRFRLEVGPPRVDAERVALFEAWHRFREGARGWKAAPMDEEGYHLGLAAYHPAAREVAYYDGGRLVALGICDVTPRAWSATMFFYHPEVARLSPGVGNVLTCVDLARTAGIPHVYLGYCVLGCPSMRYKDAFRPHEVLVGRPAADEEPRWAPAHEAPGTPAVRAGGDR